MPFCSRKSKLTCFNLTLLTGTLIVLISQYTSLPEEDFSNTECPSSQTMNLLLWLLVSFVNYFIFSGAAKFICREGNDRTAAPAIREKSDVTGQ